MQGGLTTTLELVAHQRPLLCCPLGHHFKWQVNVPDRLAQYRAGPRLDSATSTPAWIGRVLVEALDRPVRSLQVETDGARRAAAFIAGLLG